MWAFAAAAALIPWAWAIRIQYPNGGYVAGTPILPIDWFTLSRDVLAAGVDIRWSASLLLQWSMLLAVIAVTVFALWRYRTTILPFWLAVALIQALGSLATGKALVVPRYLLPVVPAFCVGLALLVAWMLRGKARALAAAAAVAVPAFFVTCCANIVYDPFYQFPDWYLVNLVVLQNEKPSDAMLFVQGFPYIVVGDFTAFRHHPVAAPAMPDDLPYTFHWIQRHRSDRIWYIENQYFYPDPDQKIKAYLDRTRTVLLVRSERRAVAGDVVNVILYSAASPAKRNTASTGVVPGVTRSARGLRRSTVGH